MNASVRLLDWQKALGNIITDANELINELQLSQYSLNISDIAMSQFQLRVPRSFVDRMKKGDPLDPLLRQVLPINNEMQVVPGYSYDPLYEAQKNPIPGLLHKYPSRVLITIAGACAINCRYCFRRHFSYSANVLSKQNLAQIINYLDQHQEVNEVIYSGGDPLLAKDKQLAEITQQLEKVPHLKRLRIHSRLPIVIPERINSELLMWLEKSRLQTILVLHCNHANEIDDNVINAIQQLRRANITVLNQTVLLKNINDSETALINLSEKLFSAGVLPYYLHLLDKVQGAAHFDIDEKTAIELVKNIRKKLPGYLVPKLVKEVAGELAKVQIN